ncbi:MAG: hypothetical protein IPJ52_02025 [Rhodocyclaceae bacterium]|nr:hypothetical protein [Rhodocyclaceae bacterium]
MQTNLKAARQAGVSLAIDDFGRFGTGYSLPGQLEGYSGLQTETRPRIHLRAARRSPRAGCRRAIAHWVGNRHDHRCGGVETERQFDILAELNVDAVQGFLRARPMDGEALVEWLRRW